MALTIPATPEAALTDGICDSDDNLCAIGMKVMNVGTVRMEATLNGYCPFVAIKEQVYQYVFDSTTFDILPPEQQNRVASAGYELDGLYLREDNIMRSNLLFVNGSVVGDSLLPVQQLYSNGTATQNNDIYLHYSWDVTGSIFNETILSLDEYQQFVKLDTGTPADEGGSVADAGVSGGLDSKKLNLPKWQYKMLNVPATTNRDEAPTDPFGTLQQETVTSNVLMPEQFVVAAHEEAAGVHWGVRKRRPVFQGSDFYTIRHKLASSSTIQNTTNQLLATFAFLDVNLSNNVDSAGCIVNGAVIELDETGVVIPASKDQFDFNNQVYFIIEVGYLDNDNYYFIIICERSNPIFVHVTNKVPFLIPGSGKCPVKVAIPEQRCSRRLSTFNGATGRDLLEQDKLIVKVQNYMGKIVVTFSEYEDTPWVIQRFDVGSPPPSGAPAPTAPQNSACSSAEDPANYTQTPFPMVIPAGLLGIYGGNIKTAFLWGYQRYVPSVTINLKSPIHFMGTSNHPPTINDVALLLGNSVQSVPDGGNCGFGWNQNAGNTDILTQPGFSTAFYQDAIAFCEYNAFDQGQSVANGPPLTDFKNTKITYAYQPPLGSPSAYKAFGKGYSPEGTEIPTDFFDNGDQEADPNSGYFWGSQADATPDEDVSYIRTSIQNDVVTEVKDGEERSVYFYGLVTLQAGSFTFPPGDPESYTGQGVKILNCITPICTGYTVYIPAQDEAWSATAYAYDVSPFVMHFNESWTSQDYAKIDHTGTIKLLCNRGVGQSGKTAVMNNYTYNSQLGGGSAGTGCSDGVYQQPHYPLVANTGDIADFIAGLTNRTFYIQLKAWYQNSEIFATPDDCANLPSNTMGSNNAESMIFTGLCHGGKVTYEAGSRIFEAQVQDLSAVLQEQHFLNSPFFDSVRDFVAVREILQMSGFRGNDASPPPSDPTDINPAELVSQAVVQSRTATSEPFTLSYYDGCYTRQIECVSYALPGSYNLLQQQKFKFSDGDKYWDALVKMATAAGKVIYFDRFGICHYEDRPDQALFQNCQNITSTDINALVKEDFYASPLIAPNGARDAGRIAYSNYTWQRHAEDVFNQIQVVTVDPNGGPIWVGDVNFDSMDSPAKEGFVGYAKQVLNQNGIFGSLLAAQKNVERLTSFYVPTLSVSFESFGRSFLKAQDIITFTGLDDLNNNQKAQPLRITSISTDIDPQKNVWWSRFETEWIYCGPGVDWGNS